MKSSLKTLLAVGALALAAGQASASTITGSFNLNNQQTVYYASGMTLTGGEDVWQVNLQRNAGLLIDLTTSNSTVLRPNLLDTNNNGQIDEAEALAQTPRVTSVELYTDFDSGTGTLSGLIGTATETRSWIPLLSSLTVVGGIAQQALSLGTLFSLQLPGQFVAGDYFIRIAGTDAVSYSGNISAVPLPGAALLFGSALLGMGAVRRKQKSDVAAA